MPRIDRLATIGLFHPLARALRLQRNTRIPVLMYHSISENKGTRHPYYETNTSPAQFDQQMRFLREKGYSAISLAEAVDRLDSGSIERSQVVITFDDGFRDFYTAAFPILQKYGLTATVFLITGVTSSQRRRFKGYECLTWEEVRSLAANGISIGSHTVNHSELRLMSEAELDYELGQSKQAIEDKIGIAVTSFSYPYAFPESDRALLSRLKRALILHGYQNGVSTVLGRAGVNNNRYILPRLPINTWDDMHLFEAKLDGGYDWLHGPQWIYKTVQRTSFLGRREPAAAGTDPRSISK